MNLKILKPEEVKSIPINTTKNSLVIGDKLDPQAVLDLLVKNKYGHITQSGAAAQENEIRIAEVMVNAPMHFILYPACTLLGLNEMSSELESKSCLINEHITNAADKDRILRKIQLLGVGITNQISLINDISAAADELITNAIYNAPYIQVNEFKSGIRRDSKTVAIDILKKPRFFLAVNDEQIFIGCCDFYGSLNAFKLVEQIQKCYMNGVASMINYSEGGAGIGSFKVFHVSSGYYVGVAPGQMTTVCCSFSKTNSGIERQSLPKSLHVEVLEGSKVYQGKSLPSYVFFEDFLDGIIVINEGGQVIYVNNMAATFLKLKSAKRMLNKTIDTQIMPASPEHNKFFKDLESPTDNFFFHEVFIRTPYSEEILVAYLGVKRFPGSDDKVIYIRDMSMEITLQDKYSKDKKRLQKALSDIETDSLTGCFNKSGILNKLSARFEASREQGSVFAVVVFDLDGFKKINDTHGHPAGDSYLVNVAHNIKSNLREGDQLGRFGGDEFVAVLDSGNRQNAISAAQKLLRVINELQVPFGETRLHCTASIGVCFYEDSMTSAEQMLKFADDCSYVSKKSGKNAVCVYPEKNIL